MKTIEEAILPAYRKAGNNAYFGNGFKAGAEFVQRWIPAIDELPEQGQSVLLKSESGKLGLVTFFTYESLSDSDHDKDVYIFNNFHFMEWRPVEYK